MNLAEFDRLADAVLYEGYALYPYRASAVKNQRRFPFGTLYPPAFCAARRGAEASASQTQCLAQGDAAATLAVRIRFLHLHAHASGDAARDDGPWPEAEARHVDVPVVSLGALCDGPVGVAFAFGARAEALQGTVTAAAERAGEGLYKLTVEVHNGSAFPCDSTTAHAAALPHAMASAHTLLGLAGAGFVSLIDPPADLAALASRCRNVGGWPVLVGGAGRRDAMLAAPMILYDHPLIAPESPGDLFDATEIDEILTLRILTLTDAEKSEVRAGGGRARALLERTEALPTDALMRLHGAVRELRPVPRPPPRALRPGDRVRLCPRGRSDILDIVLRGKMATVVSLEEDFEDRKYVTVTIDDDPGQDLGRAGYMGHRFFFGLEEVELLWA